MSNILANVKTLVSTPGMLNAYSNWLLNRQLFGKTPSINCTSKTKISGWLNFSEYWSFSQGIPQAEKLLMKKCFCNSSNQKTVAIDIGANLGLFTVTLSDVGYSDVHSFEPVPQTFSRLEANIKNNQLQKQITLNCMAVGSQQGTTQFQIFEDSPAINRFIQLDNKNSENIIVQEVVLTTLDKYCEQHSIKYIDFLKIDVEGMELFVLRGAEKLLKDRSISTILLEICPANLECVDVKIEKLYQYIIEFGYTPYHLKEDGNVGQILTLKDLQKITLANVVVIPSY